MPTTSATPTRAPTAERATVLRALALVLALAWSTLGFATTDLWVVIPPGHPLFAADEAMLEAGWGIYLSCLVVLPLLALVLRPELGRAVAAQLGVVAACTVPAAALSLDATLLLLGVVLAVTGLLVAWPSREGRRRRGGDRRTLTVVWAAATLVVFAGVPWGGFMRTSAEYYPAGSRNGAILLLATVAAAWGLAAVAGRPARGPIGRNRAVPAVPAVLVVVALGAVPWLVYVGHLCLTARHVDSYLTNGIDHWPAQAACAVAVLALPVAAVLGRVSSVRLAGSTAGLTGSCSGRSRCCTRTWPPPSGRPGACWRSCGALRWSWRACSRWTRRLGRKARRGGGGSVRTQHGGGPAPGGRNIRHAVGRPHVA